MLRSARPVVEADPTLGLSVFVDKRQQHQGAGGSVLLGHHGRIQRRLPGEGGGRKAAAGGFGEEVGWGVGVGGGGAAGKGYLAAQDVVSFLKTITPSEVRCDVLVLCSWREVVRLSGESGSLIQYRLPRKKQRFMPSMLTFLVKIRRSCSFK